VGIGVRELEIGGALGIDQNREWGQAEVRRMELFQGLEDGGGKIHAASYGLGEDDVGPHGAETIGGGDKIGEAAAETSVRNFSGIEAEGDGEAGIDQCAGLVISNDGGAQAAIVEQAGGAQDQGSFARAEKAANQSQRGAIRQVIPTLRPRGW